MKKLLLLLLLLTIQKVEGVDFVKSVENISELKKQNVFDIHDTVLVKGYYTNNDGGAGTFVLTNSATGADDGLIVQSTFNSSYAFRRVVDNYVDPKWFGCKMDGVTDDSIRFNVALGSGRDVRIPPGSIKLTSALVSSNTKILGDGKVNIIGPGSGQTFQIFSVSNVVLDGLNFAGVAACHTYLYYSTNILIRNCSYTGATNNSSFTAAISGDGNNGIVIRDCVFYNNGSPSTNYAPNYNIVFGFNSNTNLLNQNIWVENCRIYNQRCSLGAAFFNCLNSGARNLFVDMNNQSIAGNNNGYGIISYGVPSSGILGVNNLFENCTVTNAAGTGIYIQSNVGTVVRDPKIYFAARSQDDTTLAVGGIVFHLSQDCALFGGFVTNTGKSSVVLSSSTNILVLGSQLYAPATNRFGVELRGDVDSVKILNNFVGNTRFIGIGNTVGASSTKNSLISNNTITNYYDGVFIQAGSNNIVTGNTLLGLNSDAGLLLLDNSSMIHGNQIYTSTNGIILNGNFNMLDMNTVANSSVGIANNGTNNRIGNFNKLYNNTTPFADTGGGRIFTISSGSTINVSDAPFYYLSYAAPTIVTNLTGGLIGDIRTFRAANGNATLTNSPTISLAGLSNFVMGAGDTITFEYQNSLVWVERSRFVNSSGQWLDRSGNAYNWQITNYFHKPTIMQTANSSSAYVLSVAGDSPGANALLLQVSQIGKGNGFVVYTDSNSNFIHEINAVGYKFPLTNGLSGQTWTTDGSGNLSWSYASGSVPNFNPNQFTIASGTNVTFGPGASITNINISGYITLPYYTIPGTVIDGNQGNRQKQTVSANRTYTFSNMSEGKPVQVAISLTTTNTIAFTGVDVWDTLGSAPSITLPSTNIIIFETINGSLHGNPGGGIIPVSMGGTGTNFLGAAGSGLIPFIGTAGGFETDTNNFSYNKTSQYELLQRSSANIATGYPQLTINDAGANNPFLDVYANGFGVRNTNGFIYVPTLNNFSFLLYPSSLGNVNTNTATNAVFQISGLTNTIVGAGNTNVSRTNDFIFIPSSAGVPTGVPKSYPGLVPLDVNVSATNLYGYVNGGWANLSSGTGGGSGTVTSVGAGAGMELVAGATTTTTVTNQVTTLINAQSGTSYAILATDRAKLITHTNSSATADTIAQAGSTGFTNGYSFWIKNEGAGPVTITPTSCNIDGLARFFLWQNESALIQSDGSNYHVVGNLPSIRTIFTCPTVVQFSNTASATSLFGTASYGTLTLPANYLTAGKLLHIKIRGMAINGGTTPTTQIQLKLGTTVVADTGARAGVAISTWKSFLIDVIVACNSTGASGKFYSVGAFQFFTASSSLTSEDFPDATQPTSDTTVDTTASKTIDCLFTWGTGANGNRIYVMESSVVVEN